MLGNPLLRRELKGFLRARVTLVLGVAYLVVLGGLIAWMWPQEGIFSLASQASRSILLVLTVAQLLLVILYAPAFAASAITLEKEQNTYDLLFASLLRPRQIVSGKLGSAITVLLVFVALSFPIFATCFFLGAVSLREAALVYLVIGTSAVVFGLLGLCVSAVANSSQTALIATYLLLLAVAAGPWIPYLLLRQVIWIAPAMYGVRALSPVAAMASVFMPEPAGAPTGWRIFLACGAIATVVMVVFLLTSVYLRRTRPPREHGRAIDDPAELFKRKLRFPFYLIDPMRRRRNIPDWINPLFAKEMRSRAFGGGIWIFRSAYLCFAVSISLMALVAGNMVGQSPDVIRVVALLFQLGLVVLVVPSLTAGAITQERERAALDLLRLSRIGPVTFLAGKLEVAAVFMMFLVIGSAPAWYVIHYLGTNTLQEIVVCWAIIAATMVLAMAAGLFGSAVAPRTASATAVAYGSLFLVTVVTLLPFLMPDRLGGSVRDFLFALNPFASAIQTLTTGYFAEVSDLWRRHLVLSFGLSAIFLLCAWLRVRRLLQPEA